MERDTGHIDARCCLFGVHESLRDSRNVRSMNQDRLFVWKSHWKWLQWAHKLGGTWSQITRVGQPVLARLIEIQIRQPPESACWEWGGLNIQQWILPALLCGRKLLLQTFSASQTIQFPPPICSCCLLSCCPSAGAYSE